MVTREMLVEALETEIAVLTEARKLLANEVPLPPKKQPARETATRVISIEGRRRISLAQKARWAKKKRA